MKLDISKINWKKVATLGGCALAGVMAFVGAFGEQKQAAQVEDLAKRLAELEKKN